ncbi:parallel beta helix pectate lyase-like protein [Curtobacterium sp. PhB136]|nr:parallel beta helix pectate lyase-like protein [Curtobacterium sp. PhB136]
MDARHRLLRRQLLIGAGVVAVVGAASLVGGFVPLVADGEEPGVDALQRRLDTLPAGGVLTISTPQARTKSLVVRRAVTIRFVGSGALRMGADATAILVTASGARITDPVIDGVGASTGGDAHAIAVMGTRAAPISDVRVSGGRLRQLPHDGVHVEYCSGFLLEKTSIAAVGYAGVALLGVQDAIVQDTAISDVRQPAGRVNSYGITVTRDATAVVSVTRRSARVRILRNHVSGVPAWEGIDTHAGDGVEIRDNVVTGCRVGIAAVPSKSATNRAQTDVAPTGLVIAGNRITRTAALPAGSGIVVSGAGSTVGSTAPRATGSVTGNTVTGAGGTDAAGILVKLTRGLLVADNTVTSSVGEAIRIEHSNASVTVRGNRIAEVSGKSVGIDVAAGANDGSILANRIDSTSPRVRIGLRFGSPDNRFVVRRNALRAAVVPEADGRARITR